MSLPTTSPLRNVDDVQSCLDLCKTDSDFVVAVTESNRSPWFNMVKQEEGGRVNLLLNEFGNQFKNRQSAPRTFDMTTVAYVVNPQFVQKKQGMFEGRVRSVHIPSERALDIDTPLDFRIAQCLITENKGNS